MYTLYIIVYNTWILIALAGHCTSAFAATTKTRISLTIYVFVLSIMYNITLHYDKYNVKINIFIIRKIF